MKVFVIRAVVSLVFAALIITFYFPEAMVEGTLALGGLLLALAYLKQYFSKKEEDKKGPQP